MYSQADFHGAFRMAARSHGVVRIVIVACLSAIFLVRRAASAKGGQEAEAALASMGFHQLARSWHPEQLVGRAHAHFLRNVHDAVHHLHGVEPGELFPTNPVLNGACGGLGRLRSR